MLKNKNFRYLIIVLPILAIILSSSFLSYQVISYEKNKIQRDIDKFEKDHIKNIKERIKNRINRVVNLIETNIELIKEEENKDIKNIINIGYKTIEDIYNRNKHLPYEEIIKKINTRISKLKFFENESGYFFVIDFNNKVLVHPYNKEHELKNQSEIQDENGKYFVKSLTNIAITKGEGFDTWTWNKPNSKEKVKKIGYLKAFKPLNLYIVTAKYNDDIIKRIEKETLKLISIIKYSKDEYIFAFDKKGKMLYNINKDYINKQMKDYSKSDKKIVIDILQAASDINGGFTVYKPRSYNVTKNLSQKISFVKELPSLQWIIGTGQYTYTLKKQIQMKQEELKRELDKTIEEIMIFSISIAFFLIIILTYISNKLHYKLKDYEKALALKNEKLKELNEDLGQKVKIQVENIRHKDEILNQQSRLAAMGEMIGNIAHQWRQPLTAISTCASFIKMQDEMKVLDKKDMYDSLDTIVQNTQVLSQTIDDFRNFYKKDKAKTNFNIINTIEKVLSLLDASLVNKDIKIIKNVNNINLYSLENELTQAILNILTNAKDALLENNQEHNYILINIFEKNEKVHIQIKDNAGGIDEDIIHKIFEPYFTTKFKSQGTGIGLYMTSTIIINHLKGSITVKNDTFKYNKEEYKGALFEIVLDKE